MARCGPEQVAIGLLRISSHLAIDFLKDIHPAVTYVHHIYLNNTLERFVVRLAPSHTGIA